MAAAGNRLLIAIAMAFFAAFVLGGWGRTVTAAYILCAVLAASSCRHWA
jgi:TRAP-type uncharacterized transport system fused permease subunit